MIRLAIFSCGALSAMQKLIKPFKIIFPARKSMKNLTFDKSIISYEEIIGAMNRYSGKRMRFKIHHPAKGITIGPNEVTFD
jgi:hypothetical protein